MAELHLAQHPGADELLSRDPLALLIGMVLDQQIPLEWAFRGPQLLAERLGHEPTAHELAEMPTDDLVAVFCDKPALHRFPAAMARRVQEMCQLIVDEHGGDPAAVWNDAKDGADLLKRVKKLPGFGELKARIFVGLLGKQLGVTTKGWREAAGEFGQPKTYLSVADIVDEPSLQKVRAYKSEMKKAAKAKAAAAADA